MGNRPGGSRQKKRNQAAQYSSDKKTSKLDKSSRNNNNQSYYSTQHTTYQSPSDEILTRAYSQHIEANLINSSRNQNQFQSNGSNQNRLNSSNLPSRTTTSNSTTGKLIYVANYDFTGALETGELSFRKGDKLEIYDRKTYKDWWRAVNLETQLVGYVPSNYISAIDDMIIYEWYFPEAGRRDAERFLEQPHNGQGTFLVRPSDSTEGQHALSMLDLSTEKHFHVKHYRIRRNNHGSYYISEKRLFSTLIGLVDHYRNQSDGLCCMLTSSCRRIEPVIPADRHGLLELDRKQLDREILLGKGNYGEVYRGKYGQRAVAIKSMKSESKTRMCNVDKFIDEAKIMKDLLHKNIVRLYGVCTEQEPIFIVTEYMARGCLLNYLREDQGKTIKFKHILDYAAQIANGMTYLEQKRYVHCDLAARNILLGEFNVVKIADFGLAKILQGNRLQVDREAQFPIKWTAPEAATKKEYTIKSDVWSFSILLYELITYGSNPYPGMSNNEALQAVLKGYRMSKPADCHDYYYQIMTSCWHENSENRPTFESLYGYFDDFIVQSEPNYRET